MLCSQHLGRGCLKYRPHTVAELKVRTNHMRQLSEDRVANMITVSAEQTLDLREENPNCSYRTRLLSQLECESCDIYLRWQESASPTGEAQKSQS